MCPTAEPTATPAAVVAIWANRPGCCGAAAAGAATGAAAAAGGARYAGAGAAMVDADLDWVLPPNSGREEWDAGAGLLDEDLGMVVLLNEVGFLGSGREVDKLGDCWSRGQSKRGEEVTYIYQGNSGCEKNALVMCKRIPRAKFSWRMVISE